MIQIDMQMPTNCLDCPACNEYLMCAIPVNGRGWGENDVKDFSQSRPEWCPMREQTVRTFGGEVEARCGKGDVESRIYKIIVDSLISNGVLTLASQMIFTDPATMRYAWKINAVPDELKVNE